MNFCCSFSNSTAQDPRHYQRSPNNSERTALLDGVLMAELEDYCPTCHNFDPFGPLPHRDAVLRDTFGFHRITLENRAKAEVQSSSEKCYCCAVLLKACTELSSDWDKLTMWLEENQCPRVSVLGNDSCSFEIYVEGKPTQMNHIHLLHNAYPLITLCIS